jgi:hypothetical protein
MTFDQILSACRAAGITCPEEKILPADESYLPIPAAFVSGTLSDRWVEYKKRNKIVYKRGKSDCDDMEREFACFVAREHAGELSYDGDSAAAVAEFWYFRDDGLDHGANAFCDTKPEGAEIVPVVFFYEPQMEQIITLSPREAASIYHMRWG